MKGDMELSTSEASEPINWARIDEVSEGDTEFLRVVVEAFLQDAEQRASEIKAAIGASDPNGLYRTAHQLKGSSANVGADKLSELARALEVLGRRDSTSGASELYSALEIELRRVRARLLPLLAA